MKGKVWRCEDCKVRYEDRQRKPYIEAIACVFYGNYGKPPFSKIGSSDNSSKPLVATFLYCGCEDKS